MPGILPPPSTRFWRYETTVRTNWHYLALTDWLAGNLQIAEDPEQPPKLLPASGLFPR
jgi:hypothetical protein